MYSYEDRLRAVELYQKLGRRMNATLRQLGYPTKNSLKAWCAEFADKRDLRKGYCREKWQYNDEQKRRAVDHYIEQGHCLIHTIRSLGYPSREMLRAWIRELRPELGRTIAGSSSPIIAWSRGERQHAVIALNTPTTSAKEVACAVGVAREALYNWQHQLLGHAPLKRMTKKADEGPLDPQREALLKELADLDARVRRLRMEHDILEKANELIKKDAGINPLGLTSREKTKVVDALRDSFQLSDLLHSLQLARNTYFYHRLQQTLPDKYARVRAAIRSLFNDNYRCYGYRRIDEALRREGVRVSEKVVRRLLYGATMLRLSWSRIRSTSPISTPCWRHGRCWPPRKVRSRGPGGRQSLRHKSSNSVLLVCRTTIVSPVMLRYSPGAIFMARLNALLKALSEEWPAIAAA